MMGKLPLLLGLAAGYVLGSRAGRGHYDKLSDGVTKMWNDPRVQDKVETAKAKAPTIANKVTEQAKAKTSEVKDKVADKVSNNGERDLPTDTTLNTTTTPSPVATEPAVTSDSWARPEETWRNDSNTGL